MFKNLILDLGGVIIDIDYLKTQDAFISNGIHNFQELYSQAAASPLFEDLETGKIDADNFYNQLRTKTGIGLDNDTLTISWNAMLGSFYPEAIEWIKQAKSKYNLYLYSNTNIIHQTSFIKTYRENFNEEDFNALFIKAWYSNEIGWRKPYKESFEFVLNDAGIQAEDTLFIDDTLVNIEGAKLAGLQTIHLQKPMKLWELGL